MSEDKKLDDILKERLASLPAPVRDAIMSSDVEKGLRELADRHKLHLDQWQTLENEVMLTLLGLEPIDKLEENIISEIGVDAETAHALTSDIGAMVFEPIRAKLESELDAPLDPGRETEGESVEIPRETTTVPMPQLATPPETPQIEKIQRVPMPTYAPNEGSHERKDITDDPYREPII